MTLDLKRLLELAEKATPGPWTTYHASCHSESTDVVVANDPNDRVVTTCPDREPGVELANGRFVAEADPETVKTLVERLLEAEALLRETTKELVSAADFVEDARACGDIDDLSGEGCRDCLHDLAEKIEAFLEGGK